MPQHVSQDFTEAQLPERFVSPTRPISQIRGKQQSASFRLLFKAAHHAMENEQVNWI
jgi:hypothetical protein